MATSTLIDNIVVNNMQVFAKLKVIFFIVVLVTFSFQSCDNDSEIDYLHSLPMISADSVKVTKIWDNDRYCSFTSLIKYQNKYYCAFREGVGHAGDNGCIRILTSDDAKSWNEAFFLTYPNYDLRDPNLSIMPDGRLMLMCGLQNSKLMQTQTVVSFLVNPDGGFSSFQLVEIPDMVKKSTNWIWRATWFDNICYGVRYGDDCADLLKTVDGIHWEYVSTISTGFTEVQLGRMSNGDMVALGRSNYNGYVCYSCFPYKEWDIHPSNIVLQGQCFFVTVNDKLICASRNKNNGKLTNLYGSVSSNKFSELFVFPSGGDTSYPGMIIEDNRLLLSYYSSHISSSDIFIAEIPLKCLIDRGFLF